MTVVVGFPIQGTCSNGPEAEAPREEVRSIVAVQATAPQSPRHRKLTMTSPVASWTAQPSVSCALLEPRNAETVAKHLAMEVATSTTPNSHQNTPLPHPVSAGRIAAVREAVGVAAYVAEDFELALRERAPTAVLAARVDHLALLADCERALGRLPKATEMIAESKKEELPANVRVELAIAESGILSDQGKKSEAVVALQIPQLNPKRAFEYSPPPFTPAYPTRLLTQTVTRKQNAGHASHSRQKQHWVRGNFAEPEIFDMFGGSRPFEQEEKSVELYRNRRRR